jgi:hypothetical protein
MRKVMFQEEGEVGGKYEVGMRKNDYSATRR